MTNDVGDTGLTAEGDRRRRRPCRLRHRQGDGTDHGGARAGLREQRHPDDGIYVVVATVTDPSNLGDFIVVVITAEDINEDPVLSGRPELTINEIDSGAEDATNPLFVGNTAGVAPT